MKSNKQTSPASASEAGPWDSSALAKLRDWDPIWVEQCRAMSDAPWTAGVLPRKDVELISLAVNVACTNLSPGGTCRHIRGALAAGASREEILMILKIGSLLSIHTVSAQAGRVPEHRRRCVDHSHVRPRDTPPYPVGAETRCDDGGDHGSTQNLCLSGTAGQQSRRADSCGRAGAHCERGLRDGSPRGSGTPGRPFYRGRRGRKNSMISRARASGCSIAAKWPPFGMAVQRRMSLYILSATDRGGRKISRGNSAYPIGTFTPPSGIGQGPCMRA